MFARLPTRKKRDQWWFNVLLHARLSFTLLRKFPNFNQVTRYITLFNYTSILYCSLKKVPATVLLLLTGLTRPPYTGVLGSFLAAGTCNLLTMVDILLRLPRLHTAPHRELLLFKLCIFLFFFARAL